MKLAPHENKLALFPPTSGPIYIDFTAGKKKHRLQYGGGKNQPLARAIGLQNAHCPSVLDATAGMGGDSFVLASLGCQVTLIERNPAVHALLADALKRAQQAEDAQDIAAIIQRMHLVHADAADYIEQNQPQVDVIYLDPMYPEKKKQAAAKKEMQALQILVGPDLDSHRLLNAALHCAQQRVVVKRPAKAEPISHPIQPNANIQSPNTRYDIYVIKALKASGNL